MSRLRRPCRGPFRGFSRVSRDRTCTTCVSRNAFVPHIAPIGAILRWVRALDREEMDARLARADQARLELRRATVELRAFGATALATRDRHAARPERSDRGPARSS